MLQPRLEYERLRGQRRAEAARLEAIDNRFSTARGATFLVFVALLVAVLWPLISPWWLAAPVAVFAGLALLHGRAARRLERARRGGDYYDAALERLDDRWPGSGASGLRYADPAHPCSGDLDLFGEGSLFQLLCRARTRLGEDRLAEWLLRPSDIEAVRARHAAIEELRPRLELREELAVLDAEVHDELDQNQLVTWSREAAQPVTMSERVSATAMAGVSLATLFGWVAFNTPLSLFVVVLAMQGLYTWRYRRRLWHLAESADRAGSGLAILAQVLEVLEATSFRSPDLERLRRRLETHGEAPSRQIARLRNLIQALNNCRQNQFYAPLAFVLGLPVHLIHTIETWRSDIGAHIPDWLDAVAEFEALSSLAGYACEHPADPFPELIETPPDGPLFDGTGLGHPLLPDRQCVRNDLLLGGELRMLLVSGSNMSGKSTLLRTVGTNVVLALAGAPVRAERLRLSPVRLGTVMRVGDSLQEGQSLFYAVVRRMKSIVELAGAGGQGAGDRGQEAEVRGQKSEVRSQRWDSQLSTLNSQRGNHSPLTTHQLLFLFDEILQGTNSHDRRIGAEGLLKTLVENGAVGLVTTHDLALTEIVAALDSRAANVHFEDQLVDGRMTFDYKLRPGVVQKSNALELMRMMGLEV